MFKNAGGYLEVFCDYEGRVIRIASTAPLISGYLGTFREVAIFRNRQDWINSSFFNQVTDENIHEMIEWFWQDLSQEAQVS